MIRFIDHIVIFLFRLYAFLYVKIQNIFGINIRGIFFIIRLINRRFVFNIDGLTFVFTPEAADAYGLMPAGYWNEPETHLFLNGVITNFKKPVTFIDVGSSIGEFVIYATQFFNVREIIAFEPIPHCARAIRESANANGYNTMRIYEAAVSNRTGEAEFKLLTRGSTGSHLAMDDEEHKGSLRVHLTTLDQELPQLDGHAILLMDIEGHELEAMQGGIKLINKVAPVIVFEYNHITRNFFTISQVRDLLPDHYSIYRLRKDGFLDKELSNTWNCVAVPGQSELSEAVNCMVFGARQG